MSSDRINLYLKLPARLVAEH